MQEGGELERRDACPNFHGVKFFSATKANDRAKLGEKVTSWLIQNQHIEVVDYITSQSSDSEFHCVCIWLFFLAKGKSDQSVVEKAARADRESRDGGRKRG